MSSKSVRNKWNKRLRLALRSKGHCTYCGKHITDINQFTLDHVVPKKLGGTDRQDNLTVSCKKCNSKKGHSLLTEFIEKYNIKITKEIARFL